VIDTHCHLLPGVDDGPRTLADALALGRELVGQGVETVVATPHWSRAFPTTRDAATAAAELLREALEEEALPLTVAVAAELTEVVALTAPLEEIRQRSIDGRAVVVELLPDSLPAQTAAVVARLSAAGMTPVLAHPERSRAVQAGAAVLDALRAEGALVQLVAPSLTGRYGEQVRATSWELLLTARVDLLASDAHDCAGRGCELGAAGALVAELMGPEALDELTGTAPGRLLGAPTVRP
jgi:protein-tyrosine phosphatase